MHVSNFFNDELMIAMVYEGVSVKEISVGGVRDLRCGCQFPTDVTMSI